VSTYFFPDIYNIKPQCVLWLGASYSQVLFIAYISGLYLVQSLDGGVYHHYAATTAVPSYALLNTDTESCTQQHTVTCNYTNMLTAV
jgi:hypothetical protein